MRADLDHGLSKQDLALIYKILNTQAEKIQQAALFGSRATGKYKPYSDIDLVLYGDALTQPEVDAISRLFADSVLAYPVDVCAYSLIKYPAFKEHIDAVRQILFEFTQDET